MIALRTHLEKLGHYGFCLFYKCPVVTLLAWLLSFLEFLYFQMLIKNWKSKIKKAQKEKVILEDRLITIVTGSLFLLVLINV